ncbi:MFS transporter [Oscillatoria sp. FACHB-1407]|uniref:MFS transporter n=1 Tax=Oscillatoria sp. FACHB-1407 TaxID=2692847 RepID=UPI001688D133|nr:MFS transporter [Oscillatoria sp. FACHB-1407]MBD2462908.1 MFS transporter [Oscillatoria sp. FACHB-1407]
MSWQAIAVSISLLLVTAAVNLEVPLYRTYAEVAGFGNGLTAVVFAAYVAGLLPVLLLLGGISDRVGRKPTLLAGLTFAALATTLVILHPTMSMLLIARLCQGIGVGLSVGAGTAYLTELMHEAGTRAAGYVTVMTSLGFGGGALFTSAVLLHHQTLVPLSYWIVLGLTLACLVWMTRLSPQPAIGGRLLRSPYFPKGSVIPGLAIALAWAVTGLVITVIPAQLAHYQLTVWTGLALFLVNGTGALMQPIARQLSPQRSLFVGFGLLPLGYGLLVLGAALGVLPLVLGGAAIAGSACYGFTYLGGLAKVSALAGNQRARAVSGYFLCAYLGFGIPSIIIGFLSDRIGTLNALIVFGVLIVMLILGLTLALHREQRGLKHAECLKLEGQK